MTFPADKDVQQNPAFIQGTAADEGPAYGVALLAAVGAGEYKDVVEACDATVKTTTETKTNSAARKQYDAAFPLYQRLYRSLRDDFRAIAKLP